MAQVIQLKRSTTTAQPNALAAGEVAISEVGGGSLFFGKEDGSVVKFADIATLAKLAGIEDGATADMTAEEILAAVLENENTNVLTDAQVSKLNGLESSHYKGLFADKATLEALDTAGLVAGDYADVDLGVGSEVARHIWDASDNAWVEQAGASNAETNGSVKEKYEANEDTNVFDDAAKAKLAGIEAGATGDMTGAEIVAAAVAEGDFNAFTDAEKAKLANVDNMKVDGGTF